MNEPLSPSTLNAFQRRYFAWAQPYYARMPSGLRDEVERVDRWLYSSAGLWFWLLLLAAVVATSLALVAFGISWGGSVAASLIVWTLMLFVTLGAWLRPDCYTTPRLTRFIGVVLGLAYAGALLGLLTGLIAKHGLDWDRLPGLIVRGLREATPWLVFIMLAVVGLTWGVAAVRRVRMQKEVDWLRMAQERDANARLLAEARLTLLQRQIQPHFIFNTLAAVQHWVDQGDPRAAPLLKALTSFLRGSTELLAQDRAPLTVELQTVRDYLDIMATRLGGRLQSRIRIDEQAGARSLPPGLLLTLVENAIEHGISPALHGGTVTIEASEDERAWTLRVCDDGDGLSAGAGEGVGLRNCRERLAHRFGAGAALILENRGPGAMATVRIDVAAFA
jgi:two-component sensor histidine kinase